LVEELGLAPVYLDVKLAHWWSSGRSATSATARATAAGSPEGSVRQAWRTKLQADYGVTNNSWPGCQLVPAVASSGGRLHPEFAGFLRGCCQRAAETRGGQGPLPASALSAAFCHRLLGAFSVHLQRAVHSLSGGETAAGLSRGEAGVTQAWESAVWDAGPGTDGDDCGAG
jgi:hypothetical protein